MISRVREHGLEPGVQATWFQKYGVPGFESTRYIVSRVQGT